jgi:hypothetical protein
MHVQVVTFRLDGLDDAGFRALCDQIAPAFEAVPGMIAKVWLSSPETNTYGGVYLWRDRAAMEEFLGGDIFAVARTHPNFADLASHDYGVLEGPTAITHGLMAAHA